MMARKQRMLDVPDISWILLGRCQQNFSEQGIYYPIFGNDSWTGKQKMKPTARPINTEGLTDNFLDKRVMLP